LCCIEIPNAENTEVYNSLPLKAKIPSATESFRVDLCSIAFASLKGKM